MIHEDYVLLFPINPEGKFLLQHRDDDAPTYPGYWGFFGGAIEAGETPIEALRREAFEELRYVPEVEQPVLEVEYSDVKTERYGRKYYFKYFLNGGDTYPAEPFSKMFGREGETVLALQEGQAMQWLSLEECEGLKISDFNMQKIRELLGMTA